MYLQLVLGCPWNEMTNLERCGSVGADGDLRGLHREVPVVRALLRDGVKTRKIPSCVWAFIVSGEAMTTTTHHPPLQHHPQFSTQPKL